VGDAPLSKQKSRPENNFHCFEGVGLSYWRSIAEGYSPVGSEPAQGPEGSWWEFKQDIDGYVLQNGGLASPQETKLNRGMYFRFFGTIYCNINGASSGMSGGWWIDYENLESILNFAQRCDYYLARAANMLLVLPKEWHDCGYLGCALLRKQMKAFVGRGNPATGTISPANAMRDRWKDPIMIGSAHLDIKQYFVPGSRDEISAAFERKWTKHVIKPGIQIL
jgi:hypothetical protein